MRAQGKGKESARGGSDGDLLVQVSIKSDPYFKRQDNDIHVDVPISVGQVDFSTLQTPLCCIPLRKI